MTASTSSCTTVSGLDAITPRCQSCPRREGSVFCEIETASVTMIDKLKIHRTFKPGETIFYEGSAAAGLVCVYEGTVKIVKVGREGKEQIVQFLRPGEIIGHRALLGAGKHTATAIALGPVRICYIPKAAFVSMMGSDSSLQASIVRQLSEELRITEEKFVATAQHNVRQRLAEALVELKEIFGFEADGQTLDVQLLRTDIANIVGTAPESVIRMLSDFKKAGIIDMDGRRIRILRPRTLRLEAGLDN
jgi:CRP/FNR family transcriptional regulator, polysaccharide utilization system transcription regulator